MSELPPTGPAHADGAPDGGRGPPEGPVARTWAQVRLAWSLLRLAPFDTSTPLGRSNERYRRIALTTLSSVAVRGLGSIIGLVTVPLVLGYLGKERFGLWSAITTVVAWVTLFDFGIANGLVNCIARSHGRDDQAEAGRYVSTALALLCGIAGLLAATVAIAVPLVPWSAVLAVRQAVDDTTVRWSVAAALGMFVIGMPLSAVPQIYAGYQRSYVVNAFTLVGVTLGFLALLAALGNGAGMPTLVVAFGLGSLLANALGLVNAFVRMPWLRPRIASFSREAAAALASRSLPMFLMQIGALTVNETQTLILAHRCDLSTVADYSILIRVYLLLMALIQASTASFVPPFREAFERGDLAWVSAAFRKFLQVRLLMALGGSAAMVLLSNPILQI